MRISTVPTVLQRQGPFTEAVAGRVAPIYDPSTTRRAADGSIVRDAFAGNAVPDARIDPVARRLLERFPLPSSPGIPANAAFREMLPTFTIDGVQQLARVQRRPRAHAPVVLDEVLVHKLGAWRRRAERGAPCAPR